ncbi:MAG: hypothetical protein HOF69_06555 [Campylobacteraceae bacterium]|jgi:uncharacterized iron-regulated membrane protein|nr:hypothetical protein [Campylobacteraceae bacterium]MBT3882901.1 hypothetical protein [Campylobacteraceae bacterium]MBT4030251.1 hypothetical protein [Campylobacteraceae bacterium]MBT4179901.1 hypothetical protein [Campylobacteraceae bacterium]MBT4571834.1 hypothetical protein [Campylobacteraceae bacterium]
MRRIHKKVGIILAPFFIILSISGIILLFRKTELYGKETKSFLVSLHTWEIIMPYLGIILGLGLLFMSLSGIYMYFKSNKKSITK